MDNYVPDTELRGDVSRDIDSAGINEILRIINGEDKLVALAVEAEIDSIAKAVEEAEAAIRRGGRVIYCGAGTSGRLGVLDASECPPTYGVPGDMFTGIIAGGDRALRNSAEGAEDDDSAGRRAVRDIDICANDLLVGIAASGRTPYVLGALAYANDVGAMTVALTCSKNSPMQEVAKLTICVSTGPEVVTGSTRMKAGTAQKMVLNMISTATMIRLGKVYGNLMVDVRPTNEKLVRRAKGIISQVCGCGPAAAGAALEAAGKDVKTAIVMLRLDVPPAEARRALEEAGGVIARALGEAAL